MSKGYNEASLPVPTPDQTTQGLRLYTTVTAVLTPPDPISQTFMALPALLLYGVSILAAKYIEKRRMARAED